MSIHGRLNRAADIAASMTDHRCAHRALIRTLAYLSGWTMQGGRANLGVVTRAIEKNVVEAAIHERTRKNIPSAKEDEIVDLYIAGKEQEAIALVNEGAGE